MRHHHKKIMKTNFYPTQGMDLNENGEWVEVPLENVMPKWLYESLSEEDEDVEIAYVLPYLENEFKVWLMNKRDISEKSVGDYLCAYESGYDSLYEKVGIDLYHLLESIFEGTSDEAESYLTKEDAPGLVEIYVEAMLEELDKNEDAYTKAELRALSTYYAFIVDMAGASNKTFIKEKSCSLLDENEFLSWLETECRVDYENAKKIVSSVKRMDLMLPSLASEPMTFLDVLRALPAGGKRKSYINLIRTKKKEIYRNAECSYKTILNGFANINYYLNFLNNKNTTR